VATYNYMRPVWNNGAFAVSDAPETVRAAIERVVGQKGRRRDGEDDDLIQIENDAEHSLTVAWIHCSVTLRHGLDVASSYRTGKFLHALAMDDLGKDHLTLELARALFESVHGPDIEAGIASHEAIFEQLTHPDDADIARQLFVSGQPRPKWQRPTLSPPSPPPAPPDDARHAEASDDAIAATSEPTPRSLLHLEARAPASFSLTDPQSPETEEAASVEPAPISQELEPRAPECASIPACPPAPPEPERAEEHAAPFDAPTDASSESTAPSDPEPHPPELEPAVHAESPGSTDAPDIGPSLSTLLTHRSPNPVALEQGWSEGDEAEGICSDEPDAVDEHASSELAVEEEAFPDEHPDEESCEADASDSPPNAPIDDSPDLETPASTEAAADPAQTQRPLDAPATHPAFLRQDSLDAMLPPISPSRIPPQVVPHSSSSAWRWLLAAGLLAVGAGLGLLASRIEPPGPAPVSSPPPVVDAAAYEQRIATFEQRLEAMRAELEGRESAHKSVDDAAPSTLDRRSSAPAGQTPLGSSSPEADSQTAAVQTSDRPASTLAPSTAKPNGSKSEAHTSAQRAELPLARARTQPYRTGHTAHRPALAAQLAVAPPLALANAVTALGSAAVPQNVELALATKRPLGPSGPAVSAPPPSRSAHRANAAAASKSRP